VNNVPQMFFVGCAVLFSVFVIRLLIKNKIGERNSVIWLGGLLVIFFLSINPTLFDKSAKWLGISYPPSLFFFLSSLTLLTFTLYQTVQITKLTKKIKDISQYLALSSDEEHTPKFANKYLEKEHDTHDV